MLQDVQAFSEAVVRAAERTRASAVARLRAEWQDLESTIAAATALAAHTPAEAIFPNSCGET
jgi:hypothetical protein